MRKTCRYPDCRRTLTSAHRLTRYCAQHRAITQRAHKRRTWHKRKAIYRPDDDAGDH